MFLLLPDELKSLVVNYVNDVPSLIGLREAIFPICSDQLDKRIFKYISIQHTVDSTKRNYILESNRFHDVCQKYLSQVDQSDDFILFVGFSRDVMVHVKDDIKEYLSIISKSLESLQLPPANNIIASSLSNSEFPNLETLSIINQDGKLIMPNTTLSKYLPRLKSLTLKVKQFEIFSDTDLSGVLELNIETVYLYMSPYKILSSKSSNISKLKKLSLTLHKSKNDLMPLIRDLRNSCCISLQTLRLDIYSYFEFLDLSAFRSLKHCIIRFQDIDRIKLADTCSIETLQIAGVDVYYIENHIDIIYSSQSFFKLRFLSIYKCIVRSLSNFIISTPNLETLNIERTFIDRFEVYSERFKRLCQVKIIGSGLNSVGIIGDNRVLQHLDLSLNNIHCIGGLNNLKNIEFLCLNNNHIKDISDFQNSHNLKFLSIRNNLLASLPDISHFDKLTCLIGSNNKTLGSLTIKKLKKLECIIFKDCGLTRIDISGFTNSSYLKHLDFSDNILTEFPQIENCPNLSQIHLSSNQLQGAFNHNLSNCMNLRSVKLDRNNIDVFDTVLPSTISDLCLSNCKLRKVCKIVGLNSLHHLQLNSNEIDELEPIEFCQKLESIDICSNNLVQMPKFSNLPSLESLNLSDNKITEIPPDLPDSVPNLKELILRDVDFGILHTIRNFKKLEKLDISCSISKKRKPRFEGCPVLKKMII